MNTLQLSDTESQALCKMLGQLSPKHALKLDLDEDQSLLLAHIWHRMRTMTYVTKPEHPTPGPWVAPEPNKVPELPLDVAVNRVLEKWRADALYHRGAKLECAAVFRYGSAQRHKTIELTLVRLVTELEAAIAQT